MSKATETDLVCTTVEEIYRKYKMIMRKNWKAQKMVMVIKNFPLCWWSSQSLFCVPYQARDLRAEYCECLLVAGLQSKSRWRLLRSAQVIQNVTAVSLVLRDHLNTPEKSHPLPEAQRWQQISVRGSPPAPSAVWARLTARLLWASCPQSPLSPCGCFPGSCLGLCCWVVVAVVVFLPF